MIQPNNPLHSAQSAQIDLARKTIAKLRLEKEAYMRATACLANMIRAQVDFPVVDGHLAIPKCDMDAVPGHYSVSLVAKVVKEDRELAEGELEVPDEEMVVVVVEEINGGNGLVTPERPRLIL